MKNAHTVGVLIAVLGVGLVGTLWIATSSAPTHEGRPAEPARRVPTSTHATANEGTATSTRDQPSRTPTVIARNLAIPWDIAFLPDGSMLVTERPGQLVHLERGTRIMVSGVEHVGEGGLLGVALHPNFADNQFLYLYQTTQTNNGLRNRVVRYTYRNEQLEQDRIIIDELPGARYHDGGRIAFGPSGHLWVAVGDATDARKAQNPETLHGSILRLNSDGSIPTDNPFAIGERGHPAVYSYGHRNPQGLTWDDAGKLWSTEHGRSGLRSGMDEVNMITAGTNYGWPVIEGDETREGMEAPVEQSGPDVTWAPASALYHDGSVFFGGLRGASLYEAVLDSTSVRTVRRHLHERFGRLRSVVEGPDGYFYITTSNTDGRGSPVPDDDRIIRVHPDYFTTE